MSTVKRYQVVYLIVDAPRCKGYIVSEVESVREDGLLDILAGCDGSLFPLVPDVPEYGKGTETWNGLLWSWTKDVEVTKGRDHWEFSCEIVEVTPQAQSPDKG